MATPWKQVSESKEYQALSLADREAVRADYFERVIAPDVGTEDLEAVRNDFMDRTSPGLVDKARDVLPTWAGGLEPDRTQPVAQPVQPEQPNAQELSWAAEFRRSNPTGDDAALATYMTQRSNAQQAAPRSPKVTWEVEDDITSHEELKRRVMGEDRTPGETRSFSELSAPETGSFLSGESFNDQSKRPITTNRAAPEQRASPMLPKPSMRQSIGLANRKAMSHGDTDAERQQLEGTEAGRNTLEGLGLMFKDAPDHLKAAAAQFMKAAEDVPFDDNPDDIGAQWMARSRQLAQQRASEAGEGRKTWIPGITTKDMADAGASLGFSGVSSLTGLATGIPIGMVNPPAGLVMGGVASGKAAYDMSLTDYMYRLRDTYKQMGGTPEQWPAIRDATKGMARKYAAWEAGPEAISNVLSFKLLTAPVIKALGPFGKSMVAKVAATYGTELGTETITQMGQSKPDSVLSGEMPKDWASGGDWLDALKEVAPATFLITTAMGGPTAIAGKVYDAKVTKPRDERLVEFATRAYNENQWHLIPDDVLRAMSININGVAERRNGEKYEIAAKIINDEVEKRMTGATSFSPRSAARPTDEDASMFADEPVEEATTLRQRRQFDADWAKAKPNQTGVPNVQDTEPVPESPAAQVERLANDAAQRMSALDENDPGYKRKAMHITADYVADLLEIGRNLPPDVLQAGLDRAETLGELAAPSPGASISPEATTISQPRASSRIQQIKDEVQAVKDALRQEIAPKLAGESLLGTALQPSPVLGEDQADIRLGSAIESTDARVEDARQRAAMESRLADLERAMRSSNPMSAFADLRTSQGLPVLPEDVAILKRRMGQAQAFAGNIPAGVEPSVPDGGMSDLVRKRAVAPQPAPADKRVQLAKVEALLAQGYRLRGKELVHPKTGKKMGLNQAQREHVERIRRGEATTADNVVDAAAHAAATSPHNGLAEPTQPQKEAGNYQKGHIRVAGLDISVENPEGSARSGTDPNGKAWSVTMKSHYGYIRGTVGKDKDHIDVFVKPGTQEDWAGTAFVVDQVRPDTGAFDEHKIMLGFDSIEAAKAAYRENYSSGWAGLKTISATPIEELKTWLRDGNTKQPFTKSGAPEAASTTQDRQGGAEPNNVVSEGGKPVATSSVQDDTRAKLKAEVDKAKVAATKGQTADEKRASAKREAANKRQAESAVFNAAAASEAIQDMAVNTGNSDEQFMLGAESDMLMIIGDVLQERAGDKNVRDYLSGFIQNGKPTFDKAFYATLRKAAVKARAEAEKAKNRDPLVYQAALDQAGSDSNATGDLAAVFKEGFDHALKGMTKSTLSQDGFTAVRQEGYEAARKWMKTDDGRAWYEGKPLKKEKSTGDALRRVWEMMRKGLDKITADDLDKAWTRIQKNTVRADLLPSDLLAPDATGGAQRWFVDFRSMVASYKDYFMASLGTRNSTRKHWGADAVWSGRYAIGNDGPFSGHNTTDAAAKQARLDKALEIARDYQEALGEIANLLRGKKTLADIKTVIDTDLRAKFPHVFTQAVWSDLRSLESVLNSDNHRWKARVEHESIEFKQPDRSKPLVRPRLDRIVRTGLADHRRGKDIDAQTFKKTFGFADVTIGEYVTAQQAKDHLNYAYDAFMDLAEILGIRPVDISFGGQMHFAIGALGHGKHSAHFSPNHPHPGGGTVPVINLTNTRGDGALSHEWGHALDYFAGSMDSKPSAHNNAARVVVRGIKALLKRTPHTKEHGESIARSFLRGGRFYPHIGRSKPPKTHAEYALRTGYRSEQYGTTSTDYLKEALKLDGVRSTGSENAYWSNDVEPFARAFEAFVFDQLKARGARDDYLVTNWVEDGRTGPNQGYRAYPYPRGDERTKFNDLFKEFAKGLGFKNGMPSISESTLNAKDGGPYRTLTDARDAAFDDVISRLDEIAEDMRRENSELERAEQEEKDRQLFGEQEEDGTDGAEAATDAPLPTPGNTQATPDNATLSEEDLSALFDEAAAELAESTQEQPDAPPPGEATLPDVDDGLTLEDVDMLQAMMDKRTGIAIGGDVKGIPSIHDIGNLGKTEHKGYGTFETVGDGWNMSWSGGGAMSTLPSGLSYTRVHVSEGAPYPFQQVRQTLERMKTRHEMATEVEKAKAKTTQEAGKALFSGRGGKLPSTKEQNAKIAAELAKEAAKLGVQGIDSALAGLVELFGGNKIKSFPAGFDEEAYAKAKPHFENALAKFIEAGKTLKDLFKFLIQNFGQGIKPYAIQFAKDKGLAANLGAQQEEATDDKPVATGTPSAKLAAWVEQRITGRQPITWQELFAMADSEFGGTQANGVYTPKDAYDAVELGVNQYILNNLSAPALHVGPEGAKAIIQSYRDVLAVLPTQTKRTAEMDEFQQFSTPPNYAYLANWAANIQNGETYLEPSAGVGGLAAFGKVAGARVVVNEYSARRLALIKELPFDHFFAENAEHLASILPKELRPTVVVMNPPFSATAGRVHGERDTMNGAKHIEQALKYMQDGGRLVAIVGEGMAMDRPAFRAWWGKIMQEYNVRANIGIDGSGYAKYGTTFDNQVLVIDKTGRTTGDVITGKVASPDEAVGLLEGVRNDRQYRSETTQPAAPAAGERPGGTTAADGWNPAGAGLPNQPTTGTTATTGVGGGKSARTGQGSGGTRPGRPNAPGDGTGAVGEGGRNPAEPGQRTAGTDGGQDTRAGVRGDTQPGEDGGGVKLEKVEAQAQADFTNSVFEQYTPKKLRITGAKPHNTPLVESSALATVAPPDPTYTPNLPKELIESGALSDAQLEAVVYAGQAHEQFLENEQRRGFFIGDGTGVGKGREISGIILDNLRQGRKKAVWISQKKELMEDAKRDFGDIGGDTKIIFGQHKLKGDATIANADGILFSTYSLIKGDTKATKEKIKTGKPSEKPWFIKDKYGQPVKGQSFASQSDAIKGLSHYTKGMGLYEADWYSIGKDKEAAVRVKGKGLPAGQLRDRTKQIVNWLGEDFDGVIVFDEAHNMGNAVAMKGERGNKEPSEQAIAAVALQNALPKARIVYVSATGATEVSNLAYATRLGLWGPGTPFAGVGEFVSAMSTSVSAMELVAQNLKQMGLYFSRSLSFDGGTQDTRVTYDRLEHALDPYQHDVYNGLSQAWQTVLNNIDQALDMTGVNDNGKPAAGGASGKKKGAILSAFWGSHQRFFNQVITALQMPSVIASVNQDLASGHAVVMQIVNTNEADQSRALAKLGSQTVAAEDGETQEIEELDLTPREQLISFLEKAFPVQKMEVVEVTNPDGSKSTSLVPVTDSEGKPVFDADAMALRQQTIDMVRQITIPDSPLQMVINEFGPDRVAEITGRGERVVYDENGKLKTEKRGAHAAANDAQAFKDGKKDILIFSNAGGTGFSFHSDRRYKNQKRRKHYVIQPGWSADKAIQGLGRSHRTNQKTAPQYVLVTTDVPAQKRFISTIARRLESMGALTMGQRDTAGGTMFKASDNLESKYATRAVEQFFDNLIASRYAELPAFNDVLKQMGLEKAFDPQTRGVNKDGIPSVRQFLNRILSVSLEMQETIMTLFTEEMESQVELAKSMGVFDDGLKTIHHEGAVAKREEIINQDEKSGTETKFFNIEYKVKNEFFDFDKADAEIAAASKGGWFKNKKSGHVVGIMLRNTTRTDKDGRVHRLYGIRRTSGKSSEIESNIKMDTLERLDKDAARALWEEENAKRPELVDQQINMVVGTILPLWDRFTGEHVNVSRIRLDDGRKLLGRVIMPKDVDATLANLNIKTAEAMMSGADLVAAVMRGSKVTFSNNWTAIPVTVSNERRVEVTGAWGRPPNFMPNEASELGLIQERIGWQERYFIPSDKARGGKVLDALMRKKAFNAVKVQKDGDDSARLSRSTAPQRMRGHGVPMRDAKAVVGVFRSINRNAPQIHVLEDVRKAPDALLARIEAEGAMDDVEGAFHDGAIYLFPQNMQTAERVAAVLVHEGRHFAFAAMKGKALDAILLDIYNRNQAVKTAAQKKMRALGTKSVVEATEEALADMDPALLERGDLYGWKALVAHVRLKLREFAVALRRAGLTDVAKWLQDRLAGWTDADVAAMLRNADVFVRGGLGSGQGAIRMSLNRIGDDFFTEDFTLTNGTPHPSLAGVTSYEIGGPDGAYLGRVDLKMANGHPEALISLTMKVRGKGLGEKVVAGLLSDTGALYIYDMLPSSVGFWQKMGVRPETGGQWNHGNGTLTQEAYRAARPQGRGKVTPGAAPAQAQAADRRGTEGETAPGELTAQDVYRHNADLVFKSDVPNEAWLKEAIEYSKSRGRDRYGVPHMDKMTGYFKGRPMVTLSTLSTLNGERGERGSVRQESLDWLKAEMAENGLKNVGDPYIEVGYDGVPWISEGNHRIMAAEALGWYAMPIEIRYFDGGERVNGVMHPEHIINKMAMDMSDQSAWLDEQAQAKGYPDIDTLFEREPDEFLTLAEAWRAEHPARFSRASGQSRRAATATGKLRPKRGLLDTPIRMIVQASRLNRLTGRAWEEFKRIGGALLPERVKAGLGDDYGLTEGYQDARSLMFSHQRQGLRGVKRLIDRVGSLSRAEAAVLYQAAAYEADPVQVDRLIADLPEDSQTALREIKQLVHDLGEEEVMLDLLDAETFERNEWAYLHRSYRRWELGLSDQERQARQKAKSIWGDTFRMRGLKMEVDPNRIVAPAEWFKGEMKDKTVVVLKALREDGKYDRFMYAGRSRPGGYEDWEVDGEWEIRDAKDGKFLLRRDYTAEEREKMGEIEDIRFATVKTLQHMIHNVEVAKFFEWVAATEARDTLPEGAKEADSSESLVRAFNKDEWVRVPDSKLVGTQVRRYGALAGKYVPGPVWNDIRQLANRNHFPLGRTYGAILKAWKISKALALDTPIPTPTGWTTMGDLKPGDMVFDENGKPCEVLQATETQLNHQCFEVEFSDGAKIVADAGHLWFTLYRGKGGVRETRDILATLKESTRGDNNHSIPVAGALELPDAALPIPPYALGLWLGDGDKRSARLTIGGDDLAEIRAHVEAAGLACGNAIKDKRSSAHTFQLMRPATACARGHDLKFTGPKGCNVCANARRRAKYAGVEAPPLTNPTPQEWLRALGVLGRKHIPVAYLRASEAQRRELLQGLMDSDGHITESGLCGFCTVDDALKDGVVELIRSLGYKPTVAQHETRCNGERARPAWKVHFKAYADRPVFKLARKVQRLCPPPETRQRSQTRQIVAVREVPSVPVRCILVSSPSHLFLAGDAMVPTHNTALGPTVHMNNVMANVIMADWHDVEAGHLLKAIRAVVNDDRALIDAFEDNGGTEGMYALTELQREQLQPIIAELEADLAQAGAANGMIGASAALHVLLSSRIRAITSTGPWREAWEAFRLGRSYRWPAKVVEKVIDLYQSEDTVFRLAAFIKAKEDGLTDRAAGKFARQSFLDYQINAPWVQMARQTALPFVSFSYRAIPMLMETAAHKPWKIMKLSLTLGAINAIGYALSGGDEDEERKRLPKEKSGRVFGFVAPKLVRMPWNDENGSPVFLDIRRWIPVGDIVDTGQSQSAIPLPPAMMPGGPLVLLGEVFANKSTFTGKELVKDTDTGLSDLFEYDDYSLERYEKVMDHLYKGFMPNLPIPYLNTYAGDKIDDARTGKTDVFGREYDTTMAVLSGFGVKLQAYPQDVGLQGVQQDYQAQEREIRDNIRALGRQFARNGIDEEEFREKVAREEEKLRRAADKYKEKTQ